MIPRHLSHRCHHTRVFVIVPPPREGVSLALKQTRSSSRALVVTPGDTGGSQSPKPSVHTHTAAPRILSQSQKENLYLSSCPLSNNLPGHQENFWPNSAPGRARRPETKLSCVGIHTQVSHTRFWVRCGHVNDESSSPCFCPKTRVPSPPDLTGVLLHTPLRKELRFR